METLLMSASELDSARARCYRAALAHSVQADWASFSTIDSYKTTVHIRNTAEWTHPKFRTRTLIEVVT